MTTGPTGMTAGAGLGSLDRHMLHTSAALHLILTLAATLDLVGVGAPFWTALALCVLMFFQDRTIYFVYPGLILMTLGFLSPLILAGAPIALKIPPNGAEYDHGMILSLFWFIGIFSFYIPAANAVQARDLTQIRIGKTDLVPILSAIVLLLFSALMLQGGTLVSGGYRDITETRYGFIEFASLITLVGFCAARSATARKLLLVCALVYLASAFLVGLRLRFISVAIVLFCCLAGIQIKRKWKLAGLFGAFALFVLGMVRNSGFAGASLGQALSFENMYIRGALVSTPGGAFQTSKFQGYYVEYIASHEGLSGLHFLVGDILSVFITRGGLPNSIEIKALTNSYFDVPGGGLLPGYFYAYLGLGGVIVLSVLFTMLFIYILRRNGTQAFPYQVLLAAYAPRLLLYDWTVAFKMMFYFFILKLILSFLVKASDTAGHASGTPKKRLLE